MSDTVLFKALMRHLYKVQRVMKQVYKDGKKV